jgi:asparagine synthase (glutamine-hydrolysing)
MLDGSPAAPGVAERMAAVLRHRGPDDSGAWAEGPCALAHRRLSIIDLSPSARQPISNEDGSAWITYNGEVYNFASLRERLLARGHRFRSRSDTEVLVHLYEDEGDAMLDALDGMFAFGLWDMPRRRLLLARDRLGIKPLYYALTTVAGAEALLFASEVKAILASGLVRTRPHLATVESYLAVRHPVAPMTMFEGIHALPAGHRLVAEEGRYRIERWWDLEMPERREDLGEPYYRERVRDLLGEAVEKRLISDVPLGAYLSGGLDSSVVVAEMAERLGPRLKTFSIGFGDESDELPFARLVADRLQTDHTEVVLEPERYLELLPALIEQRDAPLAVPNEVALYELSRVLKRDITVVLSGEGADEIFGGYGDYARIPFDYAKARAIARLPAPLRSALGGGIEAKYEGRWAFEGHLDHFMAGYKWFTPGERASLLAPAARVELDACVADGDGMRGAFESVFERSSALPYYDRVLYALEKVHLHNLLARVDAMTMAASVEARVPFVDHRLVEFATAMPLRYKLRWRSPLHRARALLSYSDGFRDRDDATKFILRRAYARDVPPEVLNRPKVGFKVPLDRWFGGNQRSIAGIAGGRAYARDLLLSEEARERGIVDVDAVARWLEDGERHWGEFGQKVWMLVNLELWFRRYFPDGRTLAYGAEAAAK